MKDILLLNDTSEGEHWGCQAAGGTVVDAVRSLPGVKTVSRLSVELSWNFHPCPRDYDEALKLIQREPPALHEIRRHVERSSLVVVNAEGTLLGNRNPVRNLLLFLLIAIESDTPFVILNATIVPKAISLDQNGDDIISEFYRFVLPSASLVTVREASSYNNARKLGAINVWHAYDASLEKFSTKSVDDNKTFFRKATVFGSVLLSSKNSVYLKTFLSRFRQLSGCELTLCAITKQEKPIMEKMSSDLSANFEDYDSLDLRGICELVDKSSITISGRYHGCLLSAARHVPFLNYETHSGRIDDFVRHLCCEKCDAQIITSPTFSDALETACAVWDNRIEGTIFLQDQMPFLTQKSKLHQHLLNEIWSELEGVEKGSSSIQKESAEPFIVRAKIASKLLNPDMEIIDFGGYKQHLRKCHKFTSYLSIDLIQPEPDCLPGQPTNSLQTKDLPFPENHLEINIDLIEDFSFVKDFEVAVFLGVLPWLENWMLTLQELVNNGISQMVISWDIFELNRVTNFLEKRGFYEKVRIQANSKSSISHFIRSP